MQPPKSKPYDSEYVIGNDHDSPRAVPKVEEPENRALSSGEGERFARDPEELMGSKIGKRWARFLGMTQVVEEARRSGAEWARILAEEAEQLDALLETGERMRSELPSGLTRAKFLTKRLAERRQAA